MARNSGVGQFDPTEWRDINIEDVFTFLDVGEKMFNKGTSYHTAFSKSKEYLKNFITTILAHRTDGQHCEYLIQLFSCLQPQDNIISFNWDTYADYSLMRLSAPQFSTYLNMMSGHPLKSAPAKRKLKWSLSLTIYDESRWRANRGWICTRCFCLCLCA